MRWGLASLCVSVLWLSGCFGPLVGVECAEGQSPCGSHCVPGGTCAIDGGIDTGSLDSENVTEAGVAFPTLDADPSAHLDADYAGAADAKDGRAADKPVRADAPVKRDIPSDPPPDRASPDTRDAAERDARLFDGPDAPAAQSDTRDATGKDVSDAAMAATTDTPPATNPDAGDAPYAPEVPDAIQLADAPGQQPDSGGDTADTGPMVIDGADAQQTSDATSDAASDATSADTSALADAPHDTSDGPPDVLGAEPGPEAQPPCPDQQVKCAGTCVDLQTTQTHCGLCGNDCGSLPCIGGQCVSCPANQTLCDGRCVDTSVEPSHCGGCGQVCVSGACRFGDCKASTSGHLVIIGHDFRYSNVAMNRLLGNAILFSTVADVLVVEYVGVATESSVSNSHAAIEQVASTEGRRVTMQGDPTYSRESLAAHLRSADVFLVQSQTVATNSILIGLGESWASVLGTFVHTGGTIVVLDASYPINKGTSQLISRAGLGTFPTVDTVNDEDCSVSSASDPLAASMPLSYQCSTRSAVFSGEGTHVVEDQAGRPVVLHVAF